MSSINPTANSTADDRETHQPETSQRTPQERVLSGSAILLAGLAFATLINFAYNIAVARSLGPAAFGHTTAVYTLLILISSVTLSFQILTAKIVAQQTSEKARAIAYQGLHWRATSAGILVAGLLFVFRTLITSYLNLPDPLLITILAIGTVFYVPLGARRGYIQGVCNFRGLAQNLVLEGLVRLCGSLFLIYIGTGVRGVIAANAAAVAIAYLFAKPKLDPALLSGTKMPVAFREGLQAAVFFTGQVVINNCDIVVVKHFFPSDSAGVYAAVAMVGRVVFAFSWAVVSGMFPIVAETTGREDREDYSVLGTSLALVTAICLAFVVALALAPTALWTWLFGSQFGITHGINLSHLLLLYATSTGIYALCVVMISYEMSRKIANTGWLQLVVSGLVILGIYKFHQSLAQVIWVQVVTMIVLLLFVAIPMVSSWLKRTRRAHPDVLPGFVSLLGQVSEAEVISEFLKNDFGCSEFEQYRESARQLVNAPELDSLAENQARRALLFLRHGPLWRELPEGTQWFRAEISQADLHRIRVFPRAHWRKLAGGDFNITQVARRMLQESHRSRTPEAFRDKIERLRDHFQTFGLSVPGAVLLIGLNENGPLTVLDGNHRLLAAMLAAPQAVGRLEFFCGLSPNMGQCCWYRTSLLTLLRYARNMVGQYLSGSEQDLPLLLQNLAIRGAGVEKPESVLST